MTNTTDDQEPITEVIFRKWPKREGGGILALFPLIAEGPGMCESYEHVGQHSSADLRGCMQATKPATPEEYADLKHELESSPYNYRLKVLQRSPNWRRLRAAEKEARV